MKSAVTASIGKEVVAWCTRCKLLLVHVIETMTAEKIGRVHCKTCGGQHAYRKNPPGKRTSSGATAIRRPEVASGSATTYEALLRGRTVANALPYSQSARFKVGDLISHPSFGVGAITGARDSFKIEVVFADRPRMLVHGRSEAVPERSTVG
jgi:hypothetical protein